MLTGFKLDEEITSLDIDRIDTSRIKEKNFNNEDASYVKQVLGITNMENFIQLDINSSFKIEEPEGDFYTIKDFKDGNYLSIDSKGAVYLMLHDPFVTEKIFATKEEFINALKSGQFNVEDFYEQWMSKY